MNKKLNNSNKNKQITLSRCSGIDDVPLDIWKDLIASLVLSGYEVYGDKDRIVFVLSQDDEVKDAD
ncbi:MAG: hypothetical protein KBA02_00240 [Paludibacteraceae bacterium]|nr:hypothetical protein [Paludibacteraceae bacterium]